MGLGQVVAVIFLATLIALGLFLSMRYEGSILIWGLRGFRRALNAPRPHRIDDPPMPVNRSRKWVEFALVGSAGLVLIVVALSRFER